MIKRIRKKRLKKGKTTPNYRKVHGLSKSKSTGYSLDDDDGNDSDDLEKGNMKFLDDDDDDDDIDEYAGNVTSAFYQVDDSDEDGASEEEKYDNFVASDLNRLKKEIEINTTMKKENSAGHKHKRTGSLTHGRDHSRQKSLFDAIGSITEKLGVIQGDVIHIHRAGSIYTDNIRAATPPPILSQDIDDDESVTNPKTPSMPSQGTRSTVKFAEHLEPIHPMKRRRSSLPENFLFNDSKRFTVNDPNSNV